MDPDLLEEALESGKQRGKLPKAVVPTDLYGQCADYDRIFKTCQDYGVPVVVDSAEAMGAKYKKGDKYVHAGFGARASVFSFNGNKIMTTSGGGMLASDDKKFIDRARFLSQQARDPFSHYEHTEVGYNYRLSNVLAGIGRGQLRVLDQRVNQKRQVFDYYQKGLKDIPGITFMPEADYGISNRWLTVILIDPDLFGADREKVRLALEAENIESRPVWKPMHMQPVFQTTYPCKYFGGKVSEEFFDLGLCLPSGTAMTNQDMNRIIAIISKVWSRA